jgi:hypothetical protein
LQDAPISKITRAKINWSCGSNGKTLLGKHEALNSKPSPTNKKRKEGREIERVTETERKKERQG